MCMYPVLIKNTGTHWFSNYTCVLVAHQAMGAYVHMTALSYNVHNACMTVQGLQMIRGGSKEVIVLANSTTNDQGRITPISFANSLDIGPDGTIYFTDSQSFGPVLGPSFNNTDMMAICTLGILQALPHIPNVNAGTSTPLCTCMSSMYSRCSTCEQVDILLLNRLPLSLENPCRSVQVILLTHVRIWSLHAKVS